VLSKDQAIGWLIFIACTALAVAYTIALFLLGYNHAPHSQSWRYH